MPGRDTAPGFLRPIACQIGFFCWNQSGVLIIAQGLSGLRCYSNGIAAQALYSSCNLQGALVPSGTLAASARGLTMKRDDVSSTATAKCSAPIQRLHLTEV